MQAALDSSNAERTLFGLSAEYYASEESYNARPDPVDLLLHSDLSVFQGLRSLASLFVSPGRFITITRSDHRTRGPPGHDLNIPELRWQVVDANPHGKADGILHTLLII